VTTETLLSVLVGMGLSAACGFRVFVPPLVMSIAALSGNLTLSPGFAWIGTYPALVAFAVATGLEVLGYYIPWVDHFLDLIASPTAVVAGIVVAASTITGMSPFTRWSLAIIAGGGIAGTVQAITGVTRLASAATTGGLGNPVVATVEAVGSVGISILAILVPAAAVAAVAAVLLVFLWPGQKWLRRRKQA
jgi:hypothetical protein